LFISIDGIDGCGKSTVVNELKFKLSSVYKEIHIVHFPAYDTPLGQIIKQYLHNLPENQFFLSLLFEVNRLEKLDILNLGRNSDTLVLADRYYHSGRACALARSISSFDYKTLIRINHDLPKPDYSFILDIDPKLASKRMTWKTLDALERNINFQTQVRQRFLELASEYKWNVVDASTSVDLIVSRIIKIMNITFSDKVI